MDKLSVEEMPQVASESLWQLFYRGPTWDGNLLSKHGRDWLVEKEYAERGDGWNWLASEGVLLALEIGMGRMKEKRP